MALRRDFIQQAPPLSPLGVIAPAPILIETPVFQGTLAMLFKAVRDAKVDLCEIPVGPICEAYFEYVLKAPQTNLDEAAVALVALSYLIERKAWALLPSPEPEPEVVDDADALPPTLYEYAEVIDTLRLAHEERSHLHFRVAESKTSYELPVDLGKVSASDLARAFAQVLARAVPNPDAQISAKPRRNLSEQIKIVLKRLTPKWEELGDLLGEIFTVEDAVYWFLSLLELIRLGQASIQLEGDAVQFRRSDRERS